MTPVEAMASGKPVVATAEGGYLESIIHGETGLLCGAEKQSIIKAINNVDLEPEKYMASCIVQAAKFDITAFVKAVSTKAELILNY